MLKTLKFLVAALASVLLVACGGGEEPMTLSPQRIAAQVPQAIVSVTPAQAAEQLLDAAEGAYPGLFPGHKATGTYGPFAFRYYPESDKYIGVAVLAGFGYTPNGIYVVGTGFGTLASPGYQGLVTQYLTNLSIVDPLASGDKTLTVTVTVAGFSQSIVVGSVPAPTSQSEFCSELATDTTFTQIGTNGGGTMTINSCSFSGNTGNVAATLTINSPGLPFPITTSYTIKYEYQ